MFLSPQIIARKVCQLASDWNETVYLHKLNDNSVIRYWKDQTTKPKGDFIGCYDKSCQPEYVEEDLIDAFNGQRELYFRAKR